MPASSFEIKTCRFVFKLMMMIQSHIGEYAALLVAFFWTFSALAFEFASKRVGSMPVNLIRLLFALFFLCIYSLVMKGRLFPTDATAYQWFWLSVSGLVGFVIGDLFLFKAFTVIGSRFSMLIMTLAPPLTAFSGWVFLNERLTMNSLFGIFLTIAGIGIAVIGRPSGQEKLKLKIPVKGFLYGLGGAAGQAFGLILSKKGMGDYDVFGATQIRIITGTIGFGILIIIFRRMPQTIKAIADRRSVTNIAIGSFLGPFIGVALSLFSLKYTSSGIAATIMSTTPILIIPVAYILFRQKVTFKEMVGAILSVAGVAMFFI